MGWHIVQKLVEGTGAHSTIVGKYWITAFFVLRFLLVISIAKASWSGDQGDMVCNTLSPGCKNVCFNQFSPISPIRYWFFQILSVSLASIIFSIYTTHKLALVTRAIRQKKKWKAAEKEKNKNSVKFKNLVYLSKSGHFELTLKEAIKKMTKTKRLWPRNSSLTILQSYFSLIFSCILLQVVLRLAIEIAFMVGQYFLYTYKFIVPELWQCRHWPCPGVVDCFVSRPKEKTIMLCSFYVTGCIMIVLNIIELYHIGGNVAKAWSNRSQDITKEVF
uniref:Gap junction protein n=1 Tax=Ciona savignyi TaxID=51511 RepID=H2YD26_CIOSA